jgi:hypothetical protein
MACCYLSLFCCCADSNLSISFSHCTTDHKIFCSNFVVLAFDANMPHLSAEAKHHILLEYVPHSTTHSFAALARRHDIAGGSEVVRRWHQRWNRTPESLKRHEGSGATPILTSSEISRHIRAPILAANRAQRVIHYPDVLRQVQTKTGKKIALRTLQQYGKEKCRIKEKTTRKRTRAECECRHT